MKSQSLDRLLGGGISRYGLTHALRVPLPTPTSRPQLEGALRRVMSDPIASHIHPAAFTRPDSLYLEIGSLSLQTPERVEKAVRLLKSLDLDGMLLDCMQSQRPAGGDSSDLPMSSAVTCKPLFVSVSGISHNRVLHACNRLYVPVTDHLGILQPFFLALREKFLSARFLKINVQQGRHPTHMPLHSKLIYNRSLRTRELNRKPSIVKKSEGRAVYRSATFDVRGLYDKFKTLDFTSTFALERLCITGIHTMDIVKDGRVIGRGCEEVASVSLPGIDRLEEQIELKDVTYINTGNRRRFI